MQNCASQLSKKEKSKIRILDIGTGTGFFAFLLSSLGHRVTGIDLTPSMIQEAKEIGQTLHSSAQFRVMDAEKLLFADESFDMVISRNLTWTLPHPQEAYREWQRVLKPGGLFLLHYISALQEHPGDAWIKKYIFPGGVIPSLREIIQIAGDMRFYTIDVESLRRHYNKTLLEWNKNFQAHRAEVVEMFDEKFARMWELYLCACAATFQNGIIDLSQILFTNDVNNDLPMTRWY